ncbi:MAG: hypothetical protein IIA50_03820, partial [Bacteroidetes bacterium]|nr:hypothetical protein [Bacteroidota bacterium]
YLLILLFSLVLLTHVPPVQKGLVQMLVRTSNPYSNLNLSIDQTDGSFFGQLQLRGISIALNDGEQLARIDTLSIRFNLLDLFRSRTIESIELSGAAFSIAQRPDGAWTIPVSEAATDDPAGLSIHSISVRGVTGKAVFWPPEADSVWTLDRFDAEITRLRVDEAVSVEIDTVRASFSPAGVSYSVIVGLGGTISENRIDSFTAILRSEESELSAHGSFEMPDSLGAIGAIDVEIETSPLALQDIHAFAPIVNPEAKIEVSGKLSGRSDRLEFDLWAGLPGDGTVAATGRFDMGPDGSRLRVEARVSQLNPSLLAIGPGIPSWDLSARLTANLIGPALDTLDGVIIAEIEDGKLAGRSIEFVKFEQYFEAGRGRFTLDARLASGLVHTHGWIRQFDAAPTWNIEGRIDSVEVGRIMRLKNLPMRISGLFGSTREESSGDSTRTTAFLDLKGSIVGRCPVTSFRFDAESVVQNQWSVQGRVESCDSSRIRVQGGIVNQAWTVSASLDSVDVAGFLNDSVATSVSGDIRLSGLLSDASAEANINLTHLRYRNLRIDSLTLDLNLEAQQATARINVRTGGGYIRGDVRVTSVDGGRRIDLRGITFEGIDAAEWFERIDLNTSLAGSISGSYHSGTDGSVYGNGSLVLARSKINDAGLSGGFLSWTASEDGYLFDAEFQIENVYQERELAGANPAPGSGQNPGPDNGNLSLSGQIKSDSVSWRLEDLEVSFHRLNLGPLSGNANVSTRLSGSLSGSGALAAGSFTATIDSTSSINRLPIERLTLDAALNRDHITAHLFGSFSTGALDLRASASMREPFDFKATTRVQDLDFAAAVGLDTTRSAMSFSGSVSASGFDESKWRVSIDHLSGFWGDLRIMEFVADVSYDSGVLRVDTLNLAGSPGRLTAVGFATLDPSRPDTSNFQFNFRSGDSDGMGPIARLLPLQWSELDITGRLFGPSPRRRVEIIGKLDGMCAKDLRVSTVTATILGEIDDTNALSAAELRTQFRTISFSGVRSESLELDVLYDGSDVHATTELIIDERRSLWSVVSLDPFQKPYDLELNQLAADLDADEWRLLAPARIVLRELPEVTGLILVSGSGRIALNTATSNP